MAHPRVLALVMAGGKGERLMPLTRYRTKPSVPFGGRFRIIDFVLSNLVNSDVRAIYVLTQYKAQSLVEHLQRGWLRSAPSEFITIVPAQMQLGATWYRGTADAIYQNLHLIEQNRPDVVAVFSADHVYKMNVAQMIDCHIERRAACTVACLPVPREEAHDFGVAQVDDEGRIHGFVEKSERPPEMPGRPGYALASMGNYLFDPEPLVTALREDARIASQHDFGRDILPKAIHRLPVYSYDFEQNRLPGEREELAYWRDVGTIDAYFEANMDLKAVVPSLNLYNWDWPIISVPYHDPPAKFVFDEDGRRGTAVQSIVTAGTIVAGAYVKDCVLGRNCFVDAGSDLRDSILFDNVYIGTGARVRRAIIDKNNQIEAGQAVGYDLEADRRRGYHVTDTGIVVVSKAAETPETKRRNW